MSEAVILGLIGAAQGVIAAGLVFLGIVVQSTRKHARSADQNAAEARDQVTNNHSTNLREEADERHTENAEKLDILAAGQEHLIEEMTSIRRSVRRLWERSDKHSDQITDIYSTQPRLNIPPMPGRGQHRKDHQ